MASIMKGLMKHGEECQLSSPVTNGTTHTFAMILIQMDYWPVSSQSKQAFTQFSKLYLHIH